MRETFPDFKILKNENTFLIGCIGLTDPNEPLTNINDLTNPSNPLININDLTNPNNPLININDLTNPNKPLVNINELTNPNNPLININDLTNPNNNNSNNNNNHDSNLDEEDIEKQLISHAFDMIQTAKMQVEKSNDEFSLFLGLKFTVLIESADIYGYFSKDNELNYNIIGNSIQFIEKMNEVGDKDSILVTQEIEENMDDSYKKRLHFEPFQYDQKNFYYVNFT